MLNVSWQKDTIVKRNYRPQSYNSVSIYEKQSPSVFITHACADWPSGVRFFRNLCFSSLPRKKKYFKICPFTKGFLFSDPKQHLKNIQILVDRNSCLTIPVVRFVVLPAIDYMHFKNNFYTHLVYSMYQMIYQCWFSHGVSYKTLKFVGAYCHYQTAQNVSSCCFRHSIS